MAQATRVYHFVTGPPSMADSGGLKQDAIRALVHTYSRERLCLAMYSLSASMTASVKVSSWSMQ
jgi:hypothetical protein